MKELHFYLMIFSTVIFMQITPVLAVPSTLPACEYGYRVEANQVIFCDGENEFSILGADVSSFQQNDNLNFAKDKNAVYCQGTKIETNPSAFVQIETAIGYYKDSTHVFYGCSKLANSDPATFKNINNDFNQDKNNIYYQGSILEADKNSFEVIGGGYAKDNSNVYFRYSIVPSADADSFETKKSTDYHQYCDGAAVDSMDQHAYYMNGSKVCDRKSKTTVTPVSITKQTIPPKKTPDETSISQKSEQIEMTSPSIAEQNNATGKSLNDEVIEQNKLQKFYIFGGIGTAFILGIFVGLFFARKKS